MRLNQKLGASLLGLVLGMGLNSSHADSTPETARSRRGQIYTRVQIIDRPDFSIAWRAPDGLIWGQLVKDSQGRLLKMSHTNAEAHCQSQGARLPTEHEYHRLRESMSRRDRGWAEELLQRDPNCDSVFHSQVGSRIFCYSRRYRPEILPDIRASETWTAVVRHEESELSQGSVPPYALLFKGRTGKFSQLITQLNVSNAFRCVVELSDADLARAHHLREIQQTEEQFPLRSGQTLTKLTSPRAAEFREAWEDPSGLIWSQVVLDPNPLPHFPRLHADYYTAKSYCESIGADLPTLEELTRLYSLLTDPTTQALQEPLPFPHLLHSTTWAADINTSLGNFRYYGLHWTGGYRESDPVAHITTSFEYPYPPPETRRRELTKNVFMCVIRR